MTPPPTLDELIRLVRQDAASDDQLDQLATAALTVRALTDTGDAVLGHYVDQARASGRTWTEISNVLGVSKQAVHKRFNGETDFSAFTDRARRAVVAAQDAAQGLGHNYIGTEHLLLGLVAEPVRSGVAGVVLSGHGIASETIEEAIVQRVGRGEGLSSSHIPFTPKARKILVEAAPVAAVELGHSYIGTEHLLMAVSTAEGVARDILTELGVAEGARADVIRVLSGYEPKK